MRRSHSLALLAGATAAVLLGGLATPVAAAPATGTQRVMLLLAPNDRAALRAFADRGAAASPAALRAALPSSQASAAVRQVASRLGLRVVRSSRWAVQLEGPTATMSSLFTATPARGRLGRSLLSTPRSLSRYVSLALDTRGSGKLFHHFANPLGPSGDDLRASVGGGARFVPVGNAPRPTVATVQLSDWNASDLTTYIAAARVNDPTLPSSVSLTQINDPFMPAEYDPYDSVEVDLDQEAIFAVAPYAKQRLYKSKNELFGMLDSLYTIGDDALASTDDNIVAASISWGACESDIGTDAAAAAVYATFEDALSYLTLAGVTIFAASGDFGTKCSGPTQPGSDVSIPASSPRVIAVGGTNGGVLNDPTALSSWDDADDSNTPEDERAGSGGGASIIYARPTYQAATSPSATMRQIPDIAALAGAPGFDTYSTTLGWARIGGTSLASPIAAAGLANALANAGHPWGLGDLHSALYAAPSGSFSDVTVQGDAPGGGGLAADALTGYDLATGLGVPNWQNMLGASTLRGIPHLSPQSRWVKTTSVPVTVQPSLGTHPSARFRVADTQYGTPDCSLTTGEVANPAAVPAFDVTAGDSGYPVGDYDGDYLLAVIERDGPTCLIGYRSVMVDTERPTVSVPTVRPYTSNRGLVSWTGSDRTSGVGNYTVTLQRYSTTGSLLSQTVATTTGISYAFPMSPGSAYVALVKATDRAGNVSSTVASLRTTLWDNANLAFSRGWSRAASSADFMGSSIFTATAGKTATRSAVVGKAYYLIVRTGPTCGRATITVGGTTRTLDLYSPSLRQRVVMFAFSGASASRNVTVKVLGTHNSRSRGNTVVIDGLMVTN